MVFVWSSRVEETERLKEAFGQNHVASVEPMEVRHGVHSPTFD